MSRCTSDMKALRRALVEQGWRLEPHGSYVWAVPPPGLRPRGPYADTERVPQHVKLPSTPSGSRWRQNLLATLERRGFRVSPGQSSPVC